jgi:hypothetical protein
MNKNRQKLHLLDLDASEGRRNFSPPTSICFGSPYPTPFPPSSPKYVKIVDKMCTIPLSPPVAGPAESKSEENGTVPSGT